MTAPSDDRLLRREMAVAYRSGWHFVDLVTAVPRPGDSVEVQLFGERVTVVREEDETVRAYRGLGRPRKSPQLVRCCIRYDMIFVNLDQRAEDHTLHPHMNTATPRSAWAIPPS